MPLFARDFEARWSGPVLVSIKTLRSLLLSGDCDIIQETYQKDRKFVAIDTLLDIFDIGGKVDHGDVEIVSSEIEGGFSVLMM